MDNVIGFIRPHHILTYLKEHTRTMDTSARLGGDEFAILFHYLDDKSAIPVLKEIQKNYLG